MKKIILMLTLTGLFLLNGCSGSTEKTSIIIKLYETSFLHQLASGTSDSVFLAALASTAELEKNTDKDVVEILAEKLNELDPEKSLAGWFTTFELKDKISMETGNQEVLDVLKLELTLAKQKTLEVLKKRLESTFSDKSFLKRTFNKLNVVISEMPGKNTYIIEINRKPQPERLKQLISYQADFGFWETFDIGEIFPDLQEANAKLKEMMGENAAETDSLLKENPMFSVLMPPVSHEGELLKGALAGTSKISDTARVNTMVNHPAIKTILPRDLKLMWEFKPLEYNPELIQLVAVKISTLDARPPLDGSTVLEAKALSSDYPVRVSLKMNDEGAHIWARMTAENVGRQIAIVVNNRVYSFPMVHAAIEGGHSEISGNFSPEEAADLAGILNAGQMPKIKVEVVSVQ